jgi:hypothetical protein
MYKVTDAFMSDIKVVSKTKTIIQFLNSDATLNHNKWKYIKQHRYCCDGFVWHSTYLHTYFYWIDIEQNYPSLSIYNLKLNQNRIMKFCTTCKKIKDETHIITCLYCNTIKSTSSCYDCCKTLDNCEYCVCITSIAIIYENHCLSKNVEHIHAYRLFADEFLVANICKFV